MLNRRDRLQLRKEAIMREYQRYDGDVGSPEVQGGVASVVQQRHTHGALWYCCTTAALLQVFCSHAQVQPLRQLF
jgi:hypothetical protein